MRFVCFTVRRQGKLLPRHVMWATKVCGDLYVDEQFDKELHRIVRQARIQAEPGKGLVAGPLLDVRLISAKPDWWTLTGWERVASSVHTDPLAYQQSWILIPEDKA